MGLRCMPTKLLLSTKLLWTMLAPESFFLDTMWHFWRPNKDFVPDLRSKKLVRCLTYISERWSVSPDWDSNGHETSSVHSMMMILFLYIYCFLDFSKLDGESINLLTLN